jgi:hypothetical protein
MTAVRLRSTGNPLYAIEARVTWLAAEGTFEKIVGIVPVTTDYFVWPADSVTMSERDDATWGFGSVI